MGGGGSWCDGARRGGLGCTRWRGPEAGKEDPGKEAKPRCAAAATRTNAARSQDAHATWVAGWEYDRSTLEGLKAIKFHVHEYSNGVDYVWSVNCVFDANFQEQQAKGFVEKLVLLMEPLRATSQWRAGSTLAAQESFAPTLLARMEQVRCCPFHQQPQEDRGRRVRLQPDRPSSLQANEGGKAAMVSAQVDEVKDLMAANIELMCAAD